MTETTKYFHSSPQEKNSGKGFKPLYVLYALTILVGIYNLVGFCSDQFEKSDQYLKEGYCGVIEELTFDIKKNPVVSVNGVAHHTAISDREFNAQLQIGDSIIKEPNSENFTLIKRNTGERFWPASKKVGI